MSETILLVEPDYYTQFPSLPLMKMSAYHKEHGNTVFYIKGENMLVPYEASTVNITSLYTFESKPVLNAIHFYKSIYKDRKARINFGGIMPALLPDLKIDGVNIYRGNIDVLEDVVPDYSIAPDCKTSVIYSSRGCVRKCEFCGTRMINPEFKFQKSIKKYIMPQHETITLFDNNYLAHPKFEEITMELIDAKKPVDITQGLDARLLTKEKAEMLALLTITPVIFAFDSIKVKEAFIKAIEMAQKYEVGKKTYIVTYMLYGFQDNIEDLIERVQICLDLGVRIYLMRYIPLNQMESGNFYIDPNWTADKHKTIDRLKKILSTMGTINPSSYVYTKLPLGDYVRHLDILWPYESASTKTERQRSLFEAENDNS